MVGNILMDTLRFNHTRTSTSLLLEELNLKEKNYLLFTLNRKALIKDEKKVDEVLTALLKVADKKNSHCSSKRRCCQGCKQMD